MNIVVDEWRIGNYLILQIDSLSPSHSYRQYVIDGIAYQPVPLYDMHNCIAITSDKSFVGKTVSFK